MGKQLHAPRSLEDIELNTGAQVKRVNQGVDIHECVLCSDVEKTTWGALLGKKDLLDQLKFTDNTPI